MDNNTNIGKYLLRKTSRYHFHGFALDPLREVGMLVTGQNEKIFRDRYGNLFPLLNDGPDDAGECYGTNSNHACSLAIQAECLVIEDEDNKEEDDEQGVLQIAMNSKGCNA
ncbi:unnamed protein product [Vicia faba]|uniref:Uncharacterized protein n=1 Tax=Vicia faba TaxID=3906 RepID=A0AAV0Z6G6_VICFA|nr:unnamed protein product [Vicia faba]